MSGHELERRDDDSLDRAAAVLEEAPDWVFQPTGEVFDLRRPEQAAEALDRVRELKRRLDDMVRLLEGVLRLRSREAGTKTLHLDGGWTAVVSGGSRPEYDVELLAELLAGAGLPAERLRDLIETVVTYKVKVTVAKQLAAANPAYKAAIEESRTDAVAPWRVSVKPPHNRGAER